MDVKLQQNMSVGALIVATVAAAVGSVVILQYRERRRRRTSSFNDKAVAINPDAELPQVIFPGLVYIRNALSDESQIQIVRSVLAYGHKSRKLWKQATGLQQQQWQLNNKNQGRGRIYDRLTQYEDHDNLSQLCTSLTEAARSVDPTMPNVEPTHLLTLYYTIPRKLGWHSDNGPQDGASLQPVVSVSLGNDCDFLIKNPTNASDIRTIRLQSGDAVLFGGPSRWIEHTVAKIYTDTASSSLCQLHKEMAEISSPCDNWTPPKNCFRLNLTFRHAPELLGREDEERFYYFAKSARTFMDLVHTVGEAEARRLTAERRQQRAEKKKLRKKDSL